MPLLPPTLPSSPQEQGQLTQLQWGGHLQAIEQTPSMRSQQGCPTPVSQETPLPAQ